MSAPITEEQVHDLLADASIGRAIRRHVESLARESAESNPSPDEVHLDVECAMDGALTDLPESAFDALATCAEAAARAVYEEQAEMRQQHAERDREIAEGIR